MSSSSLAKQQCCVWDQYKYAFYKKFREPKLYRQAVEGDWDLIPDRCKTHPKEATFVHSYAPKDTALHRLVRTSSCQTCDDDMKDSIFQLRQGAIASLLKVYPKAAATKDTFQRLPLHWACMDVESNSLAMSDLAVENSIILLLIKVHPESLVTTDVERRTPVHYLVARNDRIEPSLLAEVLAQNPKLLFMKDAVGETLEDIVRSRLDDYEHGKEILDIIQTRQELLKSTN